MKNISYILSQSDQKMLFILFKGNLGCFVLVVGWQKECWWARVLMG